MRRALPCLIALLVLLQIPTWARAEEGREVGKEAKAKSEFGGSISFQAVFRADWFDTIWKRSTTGGAENEAFIDGNFTLNATIVPSRSVTLFLELRSFPDAYGREAHRVGDNFNVPQFREAWIKVDDLFGKWSEGRGASLQVGMQSFRYDLRNLGRGAFFMDPTNSENPFSGLPNTETNPATSIARAYGIAPTPPPLPAEQNPGANSFLGGNPWFNKLEGLLKASEAGGLKFVLSPHKNAHIDIGAFIMLEGGIDDIEAGTNVFFFNFDFEFDLNKKTPGLKKEVTFEDTSVFNLMITAIQGRRTFIADGGIGLDLLFNWDTADLEIYAEAHYQSGEYYRVKGDPVWGDDVVTHKAIGAMAGIRVKFKDKSGMHPYVDVSGWYLTGDRGDRHEQSEDFISFESVNDTLIIESDMGLDIDCNYFAAKVEVGTHFPGSAKNVELRILGAYFNLIKTPLFQIPFKTPPAGFDEDEKNLGFEIDAKLIWRVSEGADLFLGFAYLGGSKFLDMMFNSEESTLMGIAGLNARF